MFYLSLLSWIFKRRNKNEVFSINCFATRFIKTFLSAWSQPIHGNSTMTTKPNIETFKDQSNKIVNS
nr:hypothetical protein BgiMline_018923 [Biomphalaria glabrata]